VKINQKVCICGHELSEHDKKVCYAIPDHDCLCQKETKEKIKKILQLQKKSKLSYKERKELDKLLEDIIVFYDPKKKVFTISGGGIVTLWFRNLPKKSDLRKNVDWELRRIEAFEKRFNIKFSCRFGVDNVKMKQSNRVKK